MPGPVIKKVFTVLLPVGLTVAVAALIYSHSQKNHFTIKKPPLFQSVFTTQGESSRALKIEISNESVLSHSEEVVVRAVLSAPFDISAPVQYRWKLGENVTIVSGEKSGQLSYLNRNEPVTLTLKVRGFGTESNRHIGMEITSVYGGRSFFGDALVASDPDQTFENTVQNVERIKANQ